MKKYFTRPYHAKHDQGIRDRMTRRIPRVNSGEFRYHGVIIALANKTI